MALSAAGGSMIGMPHGTGSYRPVYGHTLGVRSLREDYAKPVNRPAIAVNLSTAEEHLGEGASEMMSDERRELPRFQHLFRNGEVFPVGVFLMALQLGPAETLNGRPMPFDGEVLVLRDNLVAAYKPLVAKIRQLNSKEIAEIPQRLLQNFAKAWSVWESAWLRNREVHAVEALQPLAKAILSLEPLLISIDKERLLPWPRVKHQKVVTLKCLEGFVHSFSDLSAAVLPSLRRELDPDPRLLLLMDHVLMLRGDRSVESCLKGVANCPEVNFPDHAASAGNLSTSHGASAKDLHLATAQKGKGLPVDTYVFKLLGSSVGDSVAAGKVQVIDGRPPVDAVAGQEKPKGAVPGAPGVPLLELKDNTANRKAAGHALELLQAFESVKDMLLSLKSTLEFIDPALDQDEAFVAQLQRFERSFRKAKRMFLEPDNLA